MREKTNRKKKREEKEQQAEDKEVVQLWRRSIGGGSSAILVLTRERRDCGGVVALRSPYLPSPSERLREEWWRGKERRLLKVGGKFGSAAKLTELSSLLLKRNFPASLRRPLPFSSSQRLLYSSRLTSPSLFSPRTTSGFSSTFRLVQRSE